MLFIDYVHYKGGTFNLCVVSDNKGRYASSLKGKEAAIKNFKRKYGKDSINDKLLWKLENKGWNQSEI